MPHTLKTDSSAKKPSALERLGYIFDTAISKGPSVLVVWLLIFAVVFVLLVGILVFVAGVAPAADGKTPDFNQQLWNSLLHFLDNGNFSGEQLASGAPYLIFMALVTIGGILFSAAITGILTNGLAGQLETLRKGRSKVLEQDHSLILGWSPQIFAMLGELILAHQDHPKRAIVILADRDKVQMEDDIREVLGDTGKVRIVCRTGNPIDLRDLERVSPQHSHSILIANPGGEGSDAEVIKMVLALTHSLKSDPTPPTLVAELHDAANLEAANLVGRNLTRYVVGSDLISKIMVQTCRQSGLSVVYSELLSFKGMELYFVPCFIHTPDTLEPKTFGEALAAFEQISVLGLRRPSGQILLNPPMDTTLEASDQYIVLAQDAAQIAKRLHTSSPNIQAQKIAHTLPEPAQPEHVLLLGWNRRATSMISELESYVAPGSRLTVVTPELGQHDFASFSRNLKNLTLEGIQSNPTQRKVLQDLRLERFQHVMVLSGDTLEVQTADAQSLLILLHLRDLISQNALELTVVSEMLDLRNRELAEITGTNDFIVSATLTSLLLVQISETPELALVFDDLFNPQGSELYLKPAQDYVTLGVDLNFYTVLEAARRRGEVALGYRIHAQAQNPDHNYGVCLNPSKSEKIRLSNEDSVLVLADH